MLKKQNNLKMKKENTLIKEEIEEKIKKVKLKIQMDEKIH